MVSTFMAIQLFDLHEVNPLMNYVIRNFGWTVFFFVKISVCFLFLPLRSSLIQWAVDLSLKNPWPIVGIFTIGLLLLSMVAGAIHFWYLGVTNMLLIL